MYSPWGITLLESTWAQSRVCMHVYTHTAEGWEWEYFSAWFPIYWKFRQGLLLNAPVFSGLVILDRLTIFVLHFFEGLSVYE